MDIAQFDRLARTISTKLSRRSFAGVLGLSVLALSGSTDAKKKRGKGKKKKRTVPPSGCTPQDPITFCGTRCGTAVDNCGTQVTCPITCPAGKTCVSNGGCGQVCGTGLPSCPGACVCNGPVGSKFCINNVPICTDVPTPCSSTADCPLGTFCFSGLCAGSEPNRCVPFCST